MTSGNETVSGSQATHGDGGMHLDFDPARFVARFRMRRALLIAARVCLALIVIAACILCALGRLDAVIAFITAALCFSLSFIIPASPKMDCGPINARLFEACDPYSYAQAYFGFLELAKTASDRSVCYVNIALGLFLQGEFKTMLSYLTSVNTATADPFVLYCYYDLWSRYYFLVEKDPSRLATTRGYLETIMHNYGSERLSKLCRSAIDRIDLFESILSADAEEGRRRLALCAPRSDNGRPPMPFLCVEHRFLAAKLAQSCGRWGLMQSECITVIEQGNTLLYVREASRMLESMPSA